MGIGDKLCAIPWQASNPRIHERALLVNISKNRFESAPSFSTWDEFKQVGYESKVRAYYGDEAGSGIQKQQPMEKTPQPPSTN